MSSYRHTRTSPRQNASPPRTVVPHGTGSPASTRRAASPTPVAQAPARYEADPSRASPPRPVSPGSPSAPWTLEPLSEATLGQLLRKLLSPTPLAKSHRFRGRDASPRAIRPSEDLKRGTSPVKLRMQHLSNRLQGLQDELQAEKATAVDDANVKRMRIEHRYNKPRLPMPTDDDRVTMLAEQVAVTRKELSELIGAREDFEEQSTKVIKAVENHINLDLTVEKRARKDLEARMLKYAEDLVIALRDDLEAEKKMRMEAQTVYHQTLEDIMEISKNIDLEAGARKQQEINIDKHLVDELGLLRDLCDQVAQKRGSLEFAFKEKLDAEFLALSLELERERRLRAKMEADHQAELDAEIELITNLINTNTKKAEEEETSLIVQVAEEADNLKQLLLEEHGNRDDSEKSMVSLMDEMYTKLHREVDEERQDRESTQERFIRMLEGLA